MSDSANAKIDSSSDQLAATKPPPKEGRRLYDHPAFRTWALAAVLLASMVISLDYLRQDLWMDELITLNSYVHNPSLSWADVFSQYKVANNHILFTAVEYIWVRIANFGNEEVMRFPGLLMGAVCLITLYGIGRQLLDRASGFFLALIMGFSPIFLAFVCQIRGYGMTFMLAALATFGALLFARDRAKRGLIYFVPSVLLLPGVVPSNIMLSASLVAFMALVAKQKGRLARQSGPLALAAIATAGGIWVYLPIMDKLMNVLRNTSGWDSGWNVLGNWVTALILHAGAFMLAAIGYQRIWRREHPDRVQDAAPGDETRALLPWLALCCAVPLAIVALWRAPFPRSLIAYLVPLTVCAFYFFRQRYVERNIAFMLVAFFVLCNTLAVTRLGTHYTTQQLRDGKIPQNLVQQFYSRHRHISDTVMALRQLAGDDDQDLVIMADFRSYLPLELYWGANGGDVMQIECYEKQNQFAFKQLPEVIMATPQILLTYHPPTAIAQYRQRFGVDIELEPIQEAPTPLGIYIVRPVVGGGPYFPPMQQPDGPMPGPGPGTPIPPQQPGGEPDGPVETL